MKIAILLLVHKNQNQINKLIQHLATDFDVYIHIDKKSKLNNHDITKKDNIYVIKKYNVYWGSFNQVKATLELLKLSFAKGYDRYLFISGQDIPLKTNKYIMDFFANNNNEYIECSKLPNNEWISGGLDRLSKYHTNSPTGICGINRYYLYLLKYFILIFNIIFRINREIDYNFYGGCNWFNLSNSCISIILKFLDSNNKYIQRFNYTLSPDEIFFQTIVMNVGIPNKIVQSSLRYTDWKTGPEYPRILRMSDYDKIKKSEMLFARKFDESIDSKITNTLYNDLKNATNQG